MTISDPREGYLSSVSLDESHVVLDPPILFLFGGEILDTNVEPKSVRAILQKHLMYQHSELNASTLVPEDFVDWIHDANYPDLLTFEYDLAKTATLVLIVLESAGSLAELGSFSVNDDLKDKLIVILNRMHYEAESYIKLGPLRQIDQNNIFSYQYNLRPIGDTFNVHLTDLVDGIKERLEDKNKTEKFDKENNGHLAFLIFELVSLFKAIKIGELKKYLIIIDCPLEYRLLKRLVFLLTKIELLTTVRYGRADYLVPLRDERRVCFPSNGSLGRFDRSAVELGTAEFYNSSAKESVRLSLSTSNRGVVL